MLNRWVRTEQWEGERASSDLQPAPLVEARPGSTPEHGRTRRAPVAGAHERGVWPYDWLRISPR
jgi:hypothetical protein